MREIILREDKPIIRPIKADDAKQWISLLKNLMNETDTMLYTINDRDFNVERCREHIETLRNLNKSEILVLETASGEIVGYLLGEIENLERKSHVMTIRGGVLKNFQIGYGRKLVNEMVEIAKSRFVKKIEVSILERNKVCINSCKKSGFQYEGIKKCAVKVGDIYENECMFGMIIG